MFILKALWSSILKSIDNELLETSGFVAYTFLLAFFPFIILLIAVASLFGQAEAIQDLVLQLPSHLPKEVSNVVMPIIENLFSNPARSLITFSIIGIFWVSSSGIESIRLALNKAYEAPETRPFFIKRGQSLLLIVALVAVVLFSSAFLVFIPALGTYFPDLIANFPIITTLFDFLESFDVFTWVEYLISLALVVLFCAAAYWGLPNHQKRPKIIIPGALLASFLCVLFSNVFSYYIQNFTSYSTVYKSLGGVIVFLLFMQFSTYFLLLGAQFNHELMRQKGWR